MSYRVPTFEEILTLAQERHRAEMPGTDAFLWPNTEHVFMRAVGGLVHMNFQYQDWIKNQRFAHSADGDELDNHGRAWGLSRKPATRARGGVKLYGMPFQTLPAGTILARSDGVQFSTIEEAATDNTGTGAVEVEALEVGAAANTAAGTILTFVDPVRAGGMISFDEAFDQIKTDDVGVGNGADTENDESYRARILFRQRNPPRGGSEADYVAWAWAVPGVTRVWAQRKAYGPGTVGVWFMTDGSSADGIPSSAAVRAVQAYIDGVAPATADVFVEAPKPATFNTMIAGLIPTRAQQDLIEAEIGNIFRRLVAPSRPGDLYTLRNSLFWQAVARVVGDSRHTIITPQDAELPAGYIPVKGNVCYS